MPAGRQRLPFPPPAGVDVLGLHTATVRPTTGLARQPHRQSHDPSQGNTSMAQLRWQKPADRSDALAIAQIRWQRTVAVCPHFPRFAILVPAILVHAAAPCPCWPMIAPGPLHSNDLGHLCDIDPPARRWKGGPDDG